jgi:hypothetical protein
MLVNVCLSLKITLPKTLQLKTLEFLQQTITMNENAQWQMIKDSDHGMYTYDPIPLPQFKTHEMISPSKIVNIEQSDSTDNISLSELPTHDNDSLKNHEQHACTPSHGQTVCWDSDV